MEGQIAPRPMSRERLPAMEGFKEALLPESSVQSEVLSMWISQVIAQNFRFAVCMIAPNLNSSSKQLIWWSAAVQLTHAHVWYTLYYMLTLSLIRALMQLTHGASVGFQPLPETQQGKGSLCMVWVYICTWKLAELAAAILCIGLAHRYLQWLSNERWLPAVHADPHTIGWHVHACTRMFLLPWKTDRNALCVGACLSVVQSLVSKHCETPCSCWYAVYQAFVGMLFKACSMWETSFWACCLSAWLPLLAPGCKQLQGNGSMSVLPQSWLLQCLACWVDQ